MTDGVVAAVCLREYNEAVAAKSRYLADSARNNYRLQEMIKKVRAYEPPTEEHVQHKKFMLEQLETSLSDAQYWNEPRLLDIDEWRKTKAAKLAKDVEYYAEKWAEEQEMTRKRNEWVRQLRGALNKAEAMSKA